MQKVRVAGFSVSLDGFSAGTEQSLNYPLGKRGPEIFQWFFHTKTFRAMHGQEGGSIDVDDEFAGRSMENFGAFILGRNMFGPVRGPWPDGSWKGWWGDNPPYHAPTFVLTHYEREPLVMEGGTTFHFVTGGIQEAVRLAKQAAGEKDVKIGGGVSTVRQYLQAGLIDSLHFALGPVVLGQGETLFAGLDLPALGFSVTEHKATEHATRFRPHAHVRAKSARYTLVYPDGREEIVLDVPRYDFNWQLTYRTLLKIPKSSRMHVQFTYDNSASNKYNPDPSKWVYYGGQSWEEMGTPNMGFLVDRNVKKEDIIEEH